MSLEEVDDLCLLAGGVKFRDDKKWKQRHATLRRLSPVANTLHLQLFKETPRGLQSKASLSLDNFRAIETGFTLDRESNTLALLCDGSSIVLAFEAREALIQWQVKIAASVPYVQQFPGQLLVAPPRSKLATGSARLHVQDLRVSLVMGAPPRLAATWAIADLRRYGPAEGKYVLEGGSRCGRAEGLHILGLSGGQAGALHAALQEAAQCRLQARRRVNRKQDESPCGMSRRTVSRSCSRDSSIARSRDSGLCRQASLQWSACSSDDCDLSDPAAAASGDVTQRPCGDGQSEVSAGSSGSDSAAGRRPPHSGSGGGSGFGSGARLPRSGSGSALRSPRPVRRCSADCACAVKVSRSSLRRTGVLDGVGEEARGGRGETTPTSPPPGARYADHVYEEPGEKPINGCRNCPRPITTCVSMDRPMSGQDSSPARPMGVGGPPGGRLVRTVAQVHDLDPALAGYDRPRPSPAAVSTPGPQPPPLPTGAKPPAAPPGSKARLSPEGVSEHLYEDPGPSEGWYQTPRPCTTCRRRQEPQDDGVYRQPACPCAGCGGHGRPVESPRPSVDGTGRMPVMNADTGQLEVPAAVQLCPQIPSEEILDTGLYSQPARPAYAVVDKSRRSGPLLPGLAPPPLPVAAPGPGEPQYANVAPSDVGPAYANCTPMAIDGAACAAGAAKAAAVVCKEGSTCAGRPPIAPVAPVSATVAPPVAIDGATYVNCSPVPAPPNIACVADTSTYVNCSPNSSQQQQPLYANEASCAAACPSVSACASACQPGCPAGNYLPMRPPAGANYLEMDGRTSRSSLRRSRSAESGGQMALRSASLGRRPMPSPKPERLRNLVVTRGPATAAGVEQRSCTLPGDSDSAVTSEAAESVPPAVPRLPLSDAGNDGQEEHQIPLSARSTTSASPRVALLSQKPRSGPEYQCLDRSRLLAQMSEPGPGPPATRGCSVDI